MIRMLSTSRLSIYLSVCLSVWVFIHLFINPFDARPSVQPYPFVYDNSSQFLNINKN